MARNRPATDEDFMRKTRQQASYAEVAARKRIFAGQQVWVQDPTSGKWSTQAEVLSREGSSYTIFFVGGPVSRQNEQFLRPVKIPEVTYKENEAAFRTLQSPYFLMLKKVEN